MSDVVQAIRSAVQAQGPESLQDSLWAMTGPSWWTGYALVCAIGALFLFITLLRETHLNAITIGRLIWLGGMITGGFVRFNSACEFLSAALMATAGTFMSVLMVTNWCGRRGTPWQKAMELLREIIWRAEGARK